MPADVREVLNAKCVACHGPEDQNADVRFDTLSANLVDDRAAAETWQEALHAVQRGEMPPDDEVDLTENERAVLTKWITSAIERAVVAQRRRPGHVTFRRLNRAEYQHTMTDLLGVETDYVRDFPPDAISSDGFRNDGAALQMSALQLEYYLESARRALQKVIVEGPPPKVYEYEFPESVVKQWRGPTEPSNRLGRSQKFLATMVDDYPEWGDFLVRVHLTAELKPDVGFPVLEVSVGYRPDTQVLFRSFDTVEVTSSEEQVFEFRGRLEDFPLPVRGQGKFPGLVVRVRNVYDDGSPLPDPEKRDPKAQQPRNRFVTYPDEPHLPKLHVSLVEFKGPLVNPWPPERHRRVLPASPLKDSDEGTYVANVLTSFMTRAYRRPATDQELQSVVDFFADVRDQEDSFEAAIRETLAFVLIRPEFLYRVEAATRGESGRLSDWELASRLSYFLWSTMPDERLFDLASKGKLSDPSVLRKEAERMLQDARSDRFVRNFSDQWLQLDTMQSVAVSPNYYPEFDNALKPWMQEETRQFFSHVLRTDGGALELLRAEFTMLNEPLARHYGIEGVSGQAFRLVDLSGTHRLGGLLGHGSILLANSTGEDSHAVRRAVWIRDRLLGDPPNSPPPNVPTLDEADPRFHELPVREQLIKHRHDEACNSCHRDLDPFGVALEHFDAVGLWREEVRRLVGQKFVSTAVEATDVLPDGTPFDGADSLKRYLLNERSDAFARALVERLLGYALGRHLELADEPVVDGVLREAAEHEYRLRDMVHLIVSSEAFRTR